MNQGASISGQGNTIVQIVGDGNQVVAEHPHLVLTRYLGRGQVRQELDLLSPYTMSTPLVGRDAEMTSLRAFLDDDQAIQVRVLTGGGGSGKTRLALELCNAVSDQGWAAGFVGRKELHRFFDQQNLSDWGWNKPTLIVVDYAAEHAKLLGQWLEELADRTSPPQHPLRMLMLERSASTESGWWTVVFDSGGWAAVNKKALLNPPEPVPISPLARTEDRLALLHAILRQSNGSDVVGLAADGNTLRDQLMKSPWGGDPLYLMMSALAMRTLGHASALTLGRTDLAEALAKREADRLRQLAQAEGLSPDLVQHLVALVTLAQGMSRTDFEPFAEVEKQAIKRPSGGDVAPLADLLQHALPRHNAIAPVLPDLIGEALLTITLKDQPGTDAVLRCFGAFGQPVTETVIRSVQDFAPGRPAPMRWLQAIVKAIEQDEQALATLDASLPTESVALRELNLDVASRLVELRLANPQASAEAKASALNGLAIALALAGQREPALGTAQEALDIRRELAAQRPDVFLPGLAMSLNNLANMLSELGQREPALGAAQEAAELYRELAEQRPDVFRPDLAAALNTLANMLSDLGQREPALGAAQEAVDIRRELAAQGLDVFRPDLAASLNNLANRLSDLGQREPALGAAQESAGLYRELAAQRPDVFLPYLAMSLNNMANTLSELGQREPALGAAQEAVDIYRELAAQRPDVFHPDLAMSLNNLANRLSDLGQHEPALGAAQEAVDIRRELVEQHPDVFRPNLASTLNTLANTLSELGQREPSLGAAQEGTELYRELAAQRPDVFWPDLAMSLNNLANKLSALGQRDPALGAAQEAAELYRNLAAQRPDVFRPDLAMSLSNLANKLRSLDQREPALGAAQEAVDIYRELAAQSPVVFQSDLARSLCVLALGTKEHGRPHASVSIAAEAVSKLGPEFMRHPDAHRELMATAISTYLNLCSDSDVEYNHDLLAPLMPFFNDQE
jgi:tetratricopeptide (TPR) repeat protein